MSAYFLVPQQAGHCAYYLKYKCYWGIPSALEEHCNGDTVYSGIFWDAYVLIYSKRIREHDLSLNIWIKT